VSIGIGPQDTAGSLHDRLAELGAKLIVDALDSIEAGRSRAEPQDDARATYAPKIKKEEARIDWSRDARALDRHVRAFNPFPGAYSGLRGAELKAWRATPEPGSGPAGTVLAADASGVVVACSEGALRITELQRPGGRRLGADEFLRGFTIAPGERFQ